MPDVFSSSSITRSLITHPLTPAARRYPHSPNLGRQCRDIPGGNPGKQDGAAGRAITFTHFLDAADGPQVARNMEYTHFLSRSAGDLKLSGGRNGENWTIQEIFFILFVNIRRAVLVRRTTIRGIGSEFPHSATRILGFSPNCTDLSQVL